MTILNELTLPRGDWDNAGYPRNRVPSVLNQLDRKRIIAAIATPKGDMQCDFVTTATGDITATFVTGYNSGRNTLCYYTYDEEATRPTTYSILFAHAIRRGQRGGIPGSTAVVIPNVPAGTSFGLALIIDAFDCNNGYVTRPGTPIVFSNPSFNYRHHVQAYGQYDAETQGNIIYFEDIDLDNPLCCFEYNDCIVHLSGPGVPPFKTRVPLVGSYLHSKLLWDSTDVGVVYTESHQATLAAIPAAHKIETCVCLHMSLELDDLSTLRACVPRIVFTSSLTSVNVEDDGTLTLTFQGVPTTFISGHDNLASPNPLLAVSFACYAKLAFHMQFNLRRVGITVIDRTQGSVPVVSVSSFESNCGSYWCVNQRDGEPLDNKALLDLLGVE